MRQSLPPEIGIRYHVITSGEHKADENPHVELSEAAAGEIQAAVDTLAGMYAGLVAERRPNAPATDELLVGRSYVAGTDGMALGLIDAVTSLDSLCAALAQDPSGGAILPASSTPAPESKPMAISKATKAAIVKAVTSALDAALSEGEEEEKQEAQDDDGDGSKAQEEEEKEEGAKAQEEEEEEKEEEAQAAADAGCKPPERRALSAEGPSDAALTALSAESAKRAQAEARAGQAERDALFAARPDLSETLKASLGKVPIAEARAIVAAIEPPAKPPADARAAFVPTAAPATQGADAGADGKPTHLSASAAEMDRRMGLNAKPELGVTFDAKTGSQHFGVPKPSAK